MVFTIVRLFMKRKIRHGSPDQPVGSSGAYDGFVRERQGL